MQSNKGKSNKAALATKLIAGTKAHFANVAQLTFNSATYTPAQIIAAFQLIIDLRQAVEDAKAATATKVAAETSQIVGPYEILNAYVTFVKATFAKSPDVLAEFGIKKKASAKAPTVAAKAAAIAKRDSTRAKRNTMGSKQKRAVKGTVTGVVVTPVDAADKPVVSGSTAGAPQGASGGSTTHGS